MRRALLPLLGLLTIGIGGPVLAAEPTITFSTPIPLATIAPAPPGPTPMVVRPVVATGTPLPAPLVMTPPPVMYQPHGIYRPDWTEVPLGTPIATPEPRKGPPELPHYVGLEKADATCAQRLLDLVDLAEGHIRANCLTSAGVALSRAERHVEEAERHSFVLKLHKDWNTPRVRMLDLRTAYQKARTLGLDSESKRLAEAGAKRLSAQVEALEKAWPKLKSAEAAKQIDAVRVAIATLQSDPYLAENPAWPTARNPIMMRFSRLENDVAIRIGQGQLLEALMRMDGLKRSADNHLARGNWDDALGDLSALEEACSSFSHDLAALKTHGYNEAALVWVTASGEARGPKFLALVDGWYAEARRRWDTVELAKARARLLAQEAANAELKPPDPPVLPPPMPRQKSASVAPLSESVGSQAAPKPAPSPRPRSKPVSEARPSTHPRR